MPDSRDVRTRLLDAAVEAASIHGLSRLSVGDVAARAGLSRQTLYKHFSSKDELINEAVLREAAAMVTEVVAAGETIEDPKESLQASILVTLRVAREHPLLDRLIRTEPEALLPLIMSDGGLVASAVRAVVEQVITRRLPDLSDVETRRAADLLSRVLISYAISAPDDPPEVVAEFIATLVTQGLGTAAHT